MANKSLSDFIEDNQGLITTIALFSALATFFVGFLQDNNKIGTYLSYQFLPFVCFLIVIFLLFYLVSKLENVGELGKALFGFKIFLLLFMFFVVIFSIELFENSAILIKKLFIAIVVIILYIKLFNFGKKNEWFVSSTKELIVTAITVLVIFSSLILISTQNCDINEYVMFMITSIVYCSLIFLVAIIVVSYDWIFEKWNEIGGKIHKIKICDLAKLIGVIILSICIGLLIINILPINSLVGFIVKLVLLPRLLICGV